MPRHNCFPLLCLSTLVISMLPACLDRPETSATPLSLSNPLLSQILVIDGEPMEVSIAPVYDNKTWAFTTRWDDNNQNNFNMLAVMQEIGLEGSFYLNSFGEGEVEEYAKTLSEAGGDIGGHTMNHPFLPTMKKNVIFREILFNRIILESSTDQQVNSFAFPFGSYQDKHDPEALERISETWLTSGYLNNVYSHFMRDNPVLAHKNVSTSNQVRPGDRVIDAEGFRAQMEAILSNPAKYRAISPAISVGVHAWQSPEELEKFKTLLAEYTGRDDFWYCNQTELASYLFQARATFIRPLQGQPGHFEISRPWAAYAGSDVQLTLILKGPRRPNEVKLGSRWSSQEAYTSYTTLDITPGSEPFTWQVNLPYPAFQPAPTKIDWVACGPGFSEPRKAEKFPGLEVTVKPEKDGYLGVRIEMNGEGKIERGTIYPRTSELYRPHQLNFIGPISKRGGMGTMMFRNLPPESQGPDEGQPFIAFQIDFFLDGEAGRVYAVYLGEDTTPEFVNGSRDGVATAGPLSPEYDRGKLLALSKPGATLGPLDTSPLGQWHLPTQKQRSLYLADRFITVVPDAEWKAAAKSFEDKSGYIVCVGEIELDQSAALHVESALPVQFAAVDGEEIKIVEGQTPELKAGKHRLLLVLDSKGQMRFNREKPQWLKLTASGKPVTWMPASKLL